MKDEYVKSILESYVEQQNKKGIFIKYYDSLINTVMRIQEKLEDEDITYLYHSFSIGNMKGAYEPFLGWIKKLYEVHYARLYTVEQFISLCGVYELHKEVFCEYINTGVCKRCDEIMIEEFKFEREQMLNSVYKVFDFVSNSNSLILVISNIHMAPYSSLKLINYIMNRDDDIRFIFSYNDSFIVREYIKNEWNNLINYAEENKMVPESNLVINEVCIDYQDDFIFEENNIKEYCDIANNMYYTLALEDANYYLSIMFEKIFSQGSATTDENKLKITSIYAMVNLALENYVKTLFVCESMVPVYSKTNNVMYEFFYNYLSALAHLMMIESDLVFKFCNRCRELLEVLPDNMRYPKERYDMNVDIIEWLNRFGNLKEVFRFDYSISTKEEIIEKAKKMKCENFLGYMYIYGYDNDQESVRQIAEGIKEPVYFNKGIEIATKLGNNNLLLQAYMKNIVLYTEFGHHKYVRSMYEKRIAIMPKENKIRRAHSYSGMGYNSIVLEEYEEADKYFRNSIDVLVEEYQAEDIAETLYNMSVNYYMAGAYARASECMEHVIKIMEIIGIEGIRICNTSKLYGIMAISYYKQKKYYDVYFCINKMESFLAHILYKEECDSKLWEEDLLLYYLTKAVMSQYEGDMEKADLNFNNAYKYVENFPGAKFYSVKEYAICRADYYAAIGEQLMRHNVLKEAYTYYDENRYPYTRNMIENLIDNKEVVRDISFAESKIDFDEIINCAIHVSDKLNVQKKEKDIDFIMLSQEILVKENISTQQVVGNIMNIIQNAFNIDKLFIFDRDNDGYTTTYSYGYDELREDDIKDMFTFLENHRIGILSNRIDKDYMFYKPITSKFGIDNVATIIGIPIVKKGKINKIFVGVVDIHRNFTANRIMLKKSNLSIIKYVIYQLDEAVRRITNGEMLRGMNEKLREAAITDPLTGIYNRQGYKNVAKEQCDNSGIVMYMDVDNFKYYNDTFGHSAGDAVLKNFSDVINKCIGMEGKAIRYGGDEFLAILPEVSEEEAKGIAQKVIEGFHERLSNTIIVEDQGVGCSIGIATYIGGVSDNVDMALKYADKALYYVKNNGKGKYAVWSEISE